MDADMTSMSDDALSVIFSFLPLRDIASADATSCEWHRVVSSANDNVYRIAAQNIWFATQNVTPLNALNASQMTTTSAVPIRTDECVQLGIGYRELALTTVRTAAGFDVATSHANEHAMSVEDDISTLETLWQYECLLTAMQRRNKRNETTETINALDQPLLTQQEDDEDDDNDQDNSHGDEAADDGIDQRVADGEESADDDYVPDADDDSDGDDEANEEDDEDDTAGHNGNDVAVRRTVQSEVESDADDYPPIEPSDDDEDRAREEAELAAFRGHLITVVLQQGRHDRAAAEQMANNYLRRIIPERNAVRRRQRARQIERANALRNLTINFIADEQQAAAAQPDAIRPATRVRFVGPAMGGDRAVRSDCPFPPRLVRHKLPFTVVRTIAVARASPLDPQHKSIAESSNDGREKRKLDVDVATADEKRKRVSIGPQVSSSSHLHSTSLDEDEAEADADAEDLTVDFKSTDAYDDDCGSMSPLLLHDYINVAHLSLVSYYEVYIEPSRSRRRAPSTLDFRERAQWEFADRRQCVAVGLCNADFPLTGKQPGWDSNSYGYHGDDGHIFHRSGRGSPYGPRYGEGDVVGCGLDYANGYIFFTKNGEFLGYVKSFGRADGEWFPVVGVDSRSTVRLSLRGPFLFDVHNTRTLDGVRLLQPMSADAGDDRLNGPALRALWIDNQQRRRERQQRQSNIASSVNSATDTAPTAVPPPARANVSVRVRDQCTTV